MAADDLDADRREPTMTLTGWRRFVDAPPAQLDLLPEDGWRQLDHVERLRYDDARINTTPRWSSSQHQQSARSPGRAGC